MIWNSGDLPDNWTLKRLMSKHPSCPFNPLVANAFFRAGYIESWGRGIEKIHRECREHGIDPPVYDFGMAGLMLTFRANFTHLQVTAIEAGKAPVKTPVETGETPVETPGKTPDRLVELLRANPSMTLAKVAEEIGKSRRAVERAAARLVDERRLRYVGPRKSGRWEVLK